MSEVILQGISVDELLIRLDKLISEKIHQKLENSSVNLDENMTRKEVAQLLRISLPTLHEWTKSGSIPYHKMKARVLYKRSEVEKFLATNTIYKHKRSSS